MQKPENRKDLKQSLLDDQPFLDRLGEVDRRLKPEDEGGQSQPAAEAEPPAGEEPARPASPAVPFSTMEPAAGRAPSRPVHDLPQSVAAPGRAASEPARPATSPAPARTAEAEPEVDIDETLTYEPYFGLREKPFSLGADPRFFYSSQSHRQAFDTLLAAVRRREGLVLLTGDVGTGKTTLCRTVVSQLDQRTFTAFVQDPFLSVEGLMKRLLIDFGVVTSQDVTSGRIAHTSRHDLSLALHEFLRSLVELQAYAVVIVDEAQNLSPQLLEELRILADLDGPGRLLQVVLVGQEPLLERLQAPELRALDQRVTARAVLTPLDADELPAYVTHRLAIAGGAVTFTSEATDALYAASGGVPRVVNLVCDRALLLAARAGEDAIGARLIAEATDALGFAALPHRHVRRRRRGRRLAVGTVAVLLVLGAAGGLLWWSPSPVRQWITNWLAVPAPTAPPPPPMPAAVAPLPPPAAPATPVTPAPAVPTAGPSGDYVIQVGTFRDGARAVDAVNELVARHFRAYQVAVDLGDRGRWQEVLVGRYADRDAAGHDLQRLQAGGAYQDARVVQVTGG